MIGQFCPRCHSTVVDVEEFATADYPPSFHEYAYTCAECGRKWVMRRGLIDNRGAV